MIERVSILSATSAFADEWRQLYSRSGQDNLFLTFDWSQVWLEHFGMRRHVVLVHRDDERLSAVGLFEHGSDQYSFIGTQHSDWPGVLSVPSEQPALLPFLDHIADISDVGCVFLRGCPRTEDFAHELRRAAGKTFLAIARNARCTRGIELSGSLDAYLASRPGKVRTELKRKMRRIHRDRPPVEFRCFREGMSADSVMAAITEIESDSWKASRGNALSRCPRQSGFYRSVYSMFLAETSGRFFLLESNQEPVAFVIGAVHKGRFYALKTAYKESFSAQSPGQVLFTHLIDELSRNEPSVRIIELLGADARWKQELATSVTELCDYELLRATPKAKVIFLTANYVRPVVKSATANSPRLRDAALKAHSRIATPHPKRSPSLANPNTGGPTNILGINYYFHDSSACIVSGGKLLCAIEEERLNRQRYTTEFPVKAIARCLRIAGLDITDVDHIAVSIQPRLDWSRKLGYALSSPAAGGLCLRAELRRLSHGAKEIARWYLDRFPLGRRRPKLHFVPHHLAHIAGSFLVSPYDDAALLSLDGSGEWASSWVGHGAGTGVKCFNQTYFPMSLGAFYEAVTEFCGFRPNCDEGKTMGLAPYGDPDRFLKEVSEIVRLDDSGRIALDLSYFDHQRAGRSRCSRKFHDAFGAPRNPKEEFQQYHMDAAAAFQRVLEERALKICELLSRRTGAQYLVVGGGVALNSVMNGRIVRESGFRDLYVMPGAGDNGTCIGAAYYVYSSVLGLGRGEVHNDPYVGTSYGDAEIRAALDELGLTAQVTETPEAEAAAELALGKIVGWFQGRMEFGSRALGNRSILANSTLAETKDALNARVKHQEAFRPFASSCPVEDKDRYFDLRVDAPFMLKVCNVLPEKRSLLPAVTHVDGSAWLQTVDRHVNPKYHKLLLEFGARSGAPVLLNTSFAVMGQPIVESPQQAIQCFLGAGIDALFVGNYVLRK